MGGSSPKASQPVQTTPKVSDKETQDAAAEAVRRKQRQRGYASTVISRDMVSPEMAKKLETLGS